MLKAHQPQHIPPPFKQRWNSTSKTEWNLFNYSKDFTDGDGPHFKIWCCKQLFWYDIYIIYIISYSLLLFGFVKIYKEFEINFSWKEQASIRTWQRGVEENAGKRAHIYPASNCPKPRIRTSSRKVVNVLTVQPSKENSASKQKFVNPKSISLAKKKGSSFLSIPTKGNWITGYCARENRV